MGRNTRITPRERDRAAKLLREGKNKAEIARILGRGRKAVWEMFKDDGRARAPGSSRRPAPQAKRAVVRWWPTPDEINEALGD